MNGHNTEDAWVFVIPESGPSDYFFEGHPVFLSVDLLNSFESGDQRKRYWIDSTVLRGDTFYFPNKYKEAIYGNPVTEYLMVFGWLNNISIELRRGRSKVI